MHPIEADVQGLCRDFVGLAGVKTGATGHFAPPRMDRHGPGEGGDILPSRTALPGITLAAAGGCVRVTCPVRGRSTPLAATPMARGPRRTAALGLGVALLAGGCATERYVLQEVQRLDAPLGELPAQEEIGAATAALADQAGRLEAARELAALARERALEAASAARGDLLTEPAYTVEGVVFAPGSARLSAEAATLLDQLATRLRLEEAGVHLEIRGHTDARGDPVGNLALGRRRAEAVRRHLHAELGVPLHSMQTLSLGESVPAAANDTAQGRAANRRVVIVVRR